jgi:hypothetical protein
VPRKSHSISASTQSNVLVVAADDTDLGADFLRCLADSVTILGVLEELQTREQVAGLDGRRQWLLIYKNACKLHAS